ncbi:MAG: alpha/beta hydrolase [Odoribacter splanchnicus]|nr:alpha/beta hydrolase [Odoribacter splanchnicus]
MKISIIIICLLGNCFLAIGQNVKEYVLWPEGAPEDNGITASETTDPEGRVRNVHIARLYVYSPDKEKNTGMAVVICPGGGYGLLAMRHEGEWFARWLADRGITGIVLKYRLPNHHPDVPLADANRAIRWVRCKADSLEVKPDRIGIAGFSAGGHLASTAGTHFDLGNSSAAEPLERFSCRPDFMVLFYPVISMSPKGHPHAGSRNALLGSGQTQEKLDYFSNEKQVSEQTPPTFLVHCDDDSSVSPLNSINFYSALKQKKVPAVLYIFDRGGHGWGLRKDFGYYDQWTELLEAWLNRFL